MTVKKSAAKKVAAKKSAAKKVTATPKGADVAALKKAQRDEEVVKAEPAKQHSKTLVFMFSVGNEDRKRNLEQYEKDVRAALENTGSRHITRTGGYYIIDGKVCLEQDYDETTENFKPGKSAPPWAGGEIGNTAVERATGGEQKGSQPVAERKMRSPQEMLKDLHENTDWGRRKKAEREERERLAALATEDDVEEFEWDEEDATDIAKLEKVADKNTASAIKRLQTTETPKPKKKIVVKKKTHDAVAPAPAKKSVKRPSGVRLASDPAPGLMTVEETIAAMKKQAPKAASKPKKVVRRKK